MKFNKITYALYKKVKYLVDVAYPNTDENVIENYKKINIVLSKKTLKQNEKYEDRKCIIYNLYRQESERSNSLLICLAHHIDYLMRGETKIDSEFNKIYIHILHTAINEKMIKYDELKRTDDYKNKRVIQKALDSYWESNKKFDTVYLEIYDCYEIKSDLKRDGFVYNEYYQCWQKEVKRNNISIQKDYCFNLKSDLVFNIREKNHIIFTLYGMICVTGNTYFAKDILKKNKYFFKENCWQKKIKSSNFLKEKRNLERQLPPAQGIKIEMEY